MVLKCREVAPCIETTVRLDCLILSATVLRLCPFRWVLSHYVALIAGKWIAAEIVGGAFKYTSAARLTIWSLTLPQVAATLAATLVAFNTFDPLHQRLIDHRMFNVVLVLVLTTATLRPVLTEHFAPRMLEGPSVNKERAANNPR